MIERFYLKNYLSFEEIDLNFKKGLVVFTGPSGAGKTILMQAILRVFGFSKAQVELAEANVNASFPLEDFGITQEEINIFKFIKDKSERYFINQQGVSKKNIQIISANKINYLSSNQTNEMDNKNILFMLDEICKKNDSRFFEISENYKKIFFQFIKTKKDLDFINEEEKKVIQLAEFAKFEVDKINEINPKIGEYEELLEFKKDLSKKEKIQDALNRGNKIFDYENSVIEALSLGQINSDFFTSLMFELRENFQEIDLKLSNMENVDIESILQRLEKLSSLKTRFNSIEEALELRDKRLEEIKHYDNLSFEKKELEDKFIVLEKELENLSLILRKIRKENIIVLERLLNSYLKKLYLGEIKIEFRKVNFNENGIDELEVILEKTKLNNLSSGEFNRLRLAFIATLNELTSKGEGVLILDEVDANLSGKESMSVANVLNELSKKYQIFAISHQPQLSSQANMHVLVYKNDKKSMVKILNKEERIQELARMISGENIQEEALILASSLLKA